MNFLLNLFLGGLVLLLVGFLTPGVQVAGLLPAMLAALVFSLVAGFLSFACLGRRQHGVLAFLASGLSLWLASLLVPGFQVQDIQSALLAVLVLGLLQIAVAGAGITSLRGAP